jgi:hypothetical protein
MIKLGYAFGNFGSDRPDLFDSGLAQTRAAEGAGYDSVSLPDHLQATAVAPIDAPTLEVVSTPPTRRLRGTCARVPGSHGAKAVALISTRSKRVAPWPSSENYSGFTPVQVRRSTTSNQGRRGWIRGVPFST